MWQELKRLLQDIFYPLICLNCSEHALDGTLFCPRCRKLFLPHLQKGRDSFTYVQAVAYLHSYDSKVKKALHLVKYAGARDLLPRMAEEVLRGLKFIELQELWQLEGELCVVPIPTEPTRLKERGYDIPVRIFSPWCQRNKLRLLPLLARKCGCPPQYGLTKALRRLNVENSFTLTGQVVGLRIILVDDIYTSGATLEEAAKALLKAGAKVVYGLAFSSGQDQ